MSPDVRKPHPLTDPIHLPSPRRVVTLVVLPDSPAGSFPVPTLMTLVSTTGTDVWGPHNPGSWCYSRGQQHRMQTMGQDVPRGLPLPSSSLDLSVSRQGSPRALITELVLCFSSKWNWSLQSLGFGTAPSQGEATTHSAQSLAFSPFPWTWEIWQMESDWVTSIPGNNCLKEFYVLFMFTNVVPLNCPITIE